MKLLYVALSLLTLGLSDPLKEVGIDPSDLFFEAYKAEKAAKNAFRKKSIKEGQIHLAKALQKIKFIQKKSPKLES